MEQGEWLRKEVKSCGLTLTDRQLRQFALYYQRLVERNQVMNLTAITDKTEVYIKHFYDSLTLARVISMSEVKDVIDIGTGAGFPGIPLKIAFPHIRLVLLDSLKKRVEFLREIGDELKLSQVEYIHGRAEEWGREQNYRERFDLVTARAVAKLNTLAEYGIPFAKVGGRFVAMKGSVIAEEIHHARKALSQLGEVSVDKLSFSLPEQMGERSLLLLKKTKPTPKRYPRKPGIPAKQPI